MTETRRGRGGGVRGGHVKPLLLFQGRWREEETTLSGRQGCHSEPFSQRLDTRHVLFLTLFNTL